VARLRTSCENTSGLKGTELQPIRYGHDPCSALRKKTFLYSLRDWLRSSPPFAQEIRQATRVRSIFLEQGAAEATRNDRSRWTPTDPRSRKKRLPRRPRRRKSSPSARDSRRHVSKGHHRPKKTIGRHRQAWINPACIQRPQGKSPWLLMRGLKDGRSPSGRAGSRKFIFPARSAQT